MSKINEHRLIHDIAELCDCKSSDILGVMRTQHIADARHIARYCLRVHHGWTWQRIADLFNGHHTTGIHSCKKVRDCQDMNKIAEIIYGRNYK